MSIGSFSAENSPLWLQMDKWLRGALEVGEREQQEKERERKKGREGEKEAVWYFFFRGTGPTPMISSTS